MGLTRIAIKSNVEGISILFTVLEKELVGDEHHVLVPPERAITPYYYTIPTHMIKPGTFVRVYDQNYIYEQELQPDVDNVLYVSSTIIKHVISVGDLVNPGPDCHSLEPSIIGIVTEINHISPNYCVNFEGLRPGLNCTYNEKHKFIIPALGWNKDNSGVWHHVCKFGFNVYRDGVLIIGSGDILERETALHEYNKGCGEEIQTKVNNENGEFLYLNISEKYNGGYSIEGVAGETCPCCSKWLPDVIVKQVIDGPLRCPQCGWSKGRCKLPGAHRGTYCNGLMKKQWRREKLICQDCNNEES